MKLLTGTRLFRLRGGPWDGYTGDFVEKDQKVVDFRGFLYARTGDNGRDARVLFTYDSEQTDRLMVAKGINPRTGDSLR